MSNKFIYAIPFWVKDSIETTTDLISFFSSNTSSSIEKVIGKIDHSDIKDLILSMGTTNQILGISAANSTLDCDLATSFYEDAAVFGIYCDISLTECAMKAYKKELSKLLVGVSDTPYTIVPILDKGVIIIMNRGFYSFINSPSSDSIDLYEDTLNELLKTTSINEVAKTKMFGEFLAV